MFWPWYLECWYREWGMGELGRTNTKKDAWTSLNYILGKHFVCTRSSHLAIPASYPHPLYLFHPRTDSLSSPPSPSLSIRHSRPTHVSLALTLLYPSRTHPHVYTSRQTLTVDGFLIIFSYCSIAIFLHFLFVALIRNV